MQEISKRDSQPQVMTTNTSDRVQNQSPRQVLKTSIKVRRSFIEGTDLGSDMNPDSSVKYSSDQDNPDGTSVYKASSILEHHQYSPIYTDEYMVPSRENAKLW